MFSLDKFINDNVTFRQESMFLVDIDSHKNKLDDAICDKSVLVIGGAGSIGSSFIRSILPFKPRTLVVVDINENGIAELTRSLRSSFGMYIPSDYTTYPMDYSSDFFEKMFISRGGFDIVANFSAHKHVRSEKDIFSVEALLTNNVLHLRKLMDLLSKYPPTAYFCVSTDKAANPVNIMGASKRIMEDVIFSYSDIFPVKTARFANVAFSNGSLPDGFLKRLSCGQPLSAPVDVKRYFVSPIESGHICMLACMLGNNREIFFPKLSENQMMSFDKIATKLLNEFGYTPYLCSSDQEAVKLAHDIATGSYTPDMIDGLVLYPVHFEQSDTSGEKLYEEFYTESESVVLDRFSALGVIVDKSIPDKHSLDILYNQLEEAFNTAYVQKNDIVEIISTYLPEFAHIETGRSLDSKM